MKKLNMNSWKVWILLAVILLVIPACNLDIQLGESPSDDKGFTISIGAASLQVVPGGVVRTQVTATPINGFTGTINLRLELADGRPTPDGIAFEPQTIHVVNPDSPQTENLEISVGPDVASGSYQLQLIGESDGYTDKAAFTLNVISTNDLNEGLVAYYQFEGDATDSSGNGNDGTPTSQGVWFDEGFHGQAAVFGGVRNPGHIYVPNSPSLQFDEAKGATFAAWVRVDDYVAMDGWGDTVTDYGGGAIFAKSHDRVGAAVRYIVFKDGYTSAYLKCFDSWYYNCTDKHVLHRLGGKKVGDWTHFVLVLSDQGVQVYLDGIKERDHNCPVSFSEMNREDLYIGKFSDFWYPFIGAIDEFRVYNRALSEEEVKALYIESGGEPVPGYYVSLEADSLDVVPGRVYSLQLNVETFNGFSGDVQLYLNDSDGNTVEWAVFEPNVVHFDGSPMEVNLVIQETAPMGEYELTLVAEALDSSQKAYDKIVLNVAEADVLDEGLVAYYQFEGDATDSSGNGNDGTPTSQGVWFDEGFHGQAAVFGGVRNPGHIYVPNSPSLQFDEAKGATFAAWVRVDDYVAMDGYGNTDTSNGGGAVFAKSHDRNGAALNFRLYTDGYISAYLKCFDNWYYNCTDKHVLHRLGGKKIGDWTHFVLVLSDQGVQVYLDGIKERDHNCPVSFSEMNREDLYIGKFSDFWYPFIGAIDEFRIYNRALSEEEVKALYIESGGEPVPGYYVSLEADSLDVAPGQVYPLQLSVEAFNGFSGDVQLYLNDSDGNTVEWAVLEPNVVHFDGSPVKVSLVIQETAPMGEYELTLVAEALDSSQKAYDDLELKVQSSE